MISKRFVFLYLMISGSLFAQKSSFLLQDQSGKILIEKGDVNARHAPCSTFKIPIALMGFDRGILYDAFHPKWTYKKGYKPELPLWDVKAYPMIWMRRSIVWYSQEITKAFGREKFQTYLNRWNYGNRDVSGDPRKKEGFTESWLTSSLQISVKEQVNFMSKLLKAQLAVSQKTYEHVQNILFSEELPDAWELYGKTGAGFFQDAKGVVHHNKPIGWFVGWIKKQDRWYAFAHCAEYEGKPVLIAGKQSRLEAIGYLKAFIQKTSALK